MNSDHAIGRFPAQIFFGNDFAGHAIINPNTAALLGITSEESAYVYLAEGSDCVLAVTVSSDAHEGTLSLTATQQHNLHIKEGLTTKIKHFIRPAENFTLVDIDLEVSLLGRINDDIEPCTIDATWLTKQFFNAYLGLILAVNEACVFPLPEHVQGNSFLSEDAEILLRMRNCNSLEEDAAAETVGYHCYRGLISPGTRVYLTLSEKESAKGIQLSSALQRPPPGANSHVISIYTNDGECFPVHRQLLRPCISLTKAVRTQGPGVTAEVDVDTLTFDRVLIFLESQALGKTPPSFGIHLIPALKEEASSLGLVSLHSWCEQRLGDSAARRRWHSFAEIEKRNGAGECLLTMDGMVFDVTKWLPEHPGGSRIIPAQALNIDSSRFFELYHASRESFIYLREFYVGEILPGDLEAVPRSSTEPSEDFLRQLRQWTKDFRLEESGQSGVDDEPRNFKSF